MTKEVMLEEKNKNYQAELIQQLTEMKLTGKTAELVNLLVLAQQTDIVEYENQICEVVLTDANSLADILNNSLEEFFRITLPAKWAKLFSAMFLELNDFAEARNIEIDNQLPIKEQYFYKSSVLKYITAVYFNYNDFSLTDYLLELDSRKYTFYSPDEFIVTEALNIEIKKGNQEIISIIKDYIQNNLDTAEFGWSQLAHLLLRCESYELRKEMIQTLLTDKIIQWKNLDSSTRMEHLDYLIHLIKLNNDVEAKNELLSWTKKMNPEGSKYIKRHPALEENKYDCQKQEQIRANLNQLYDPQKLPQFSIEYKITGTLKAYITISKERLLEIWNLLVELLEEHKDYTYQIIDEYDDSIKKVCLKEVYRWDKEGNGSYVLAKEITEALQNNDVSLMELSRLFQMLSLQRRRKWNRLTYFSWARELLEQDFNTASFYSLAKEMRNNAYYSIILDIIWTSLNQIDSREKFDFAYNLLVDYMLKNQDEDVFQKQIQEPQYSYYLERCYLFGSEEVFYFLRVKHNNHTDLDNFRKSIALSYQLSYLSNQECIGLSIDDIVRAVKEGILSESELYRIILKKNRKKIDYYSKVSRLKEEEIYQEPLVKKVIARMEEELNHKK